MAPGPARHPHAYDGLSASFVARCQSAYVRGDKALLGDCPWKILDPLHHDFGPAQLVQYLLISLAMVIVPAVILGWMFAGRTVRPLQRIAATARAASQHNLSARVGLGGPRDELRELAETFDEMLAQLQTAFETQRRFIANASHELRTPLAVMRATVDVVAGNANSTPDELRSMAADIRNAVDHAERLIGALLILARAERGLTVHDPVDLATVAEDVLDTAALGDRRMHLTLEPAVIWGDPVLAERLIANLIDNALRYNIPAGEVWISTCSQPDGCKLAVANTGPVISQTDADRIFQPFQRLNDRTSHDGFGLGLAIVASIAEIHAGAVSTHPRDQGGLSVTVNFPSADPSTRAPEIQATDRPAVPLPDSRARDSRLQVQA
ncbi:MAG: ATP-binding protein [Solirubrobacteraceae bacterium]